MLIRIRLKNTLVLDALQLNLTQQVAINPDVFVSGVNIGSQDLFDHVGNYHETAYKVSLHCSKYIQLVWIQNSDLSIREIQRRFNVWVVF